MKKPLVAYFSASGVTSTLAIFLADAIDADLFEIQPKIPYTEADLDWKNPRSRSTVEMNDKSIRPSIAHKLENMDQYDTIFLGFPIWWGVAPTIINTFLEQYDFSGKTIIPFATSGSSGIEAAIPELEPSCPGAILQEGKRFEADAGEAELKAWAEEICG